MFEIREMQAQDVKAAAQIEAENFSKPWKEAEQDPEYHETRETLWE